LAPSAGRQWLYLNLAVACLRDGLGEHVRRSVDDVKQRWKARAQAPPKLRHGLGDRRLGNCCRRKTESRREDLAPLHVIVSRPVAGQQVNIRNGGASRGNWGARRRRTRPVHATFRRQDWNFWLRGRPHVEDIDTLLIAFRTPPAP